MKSRSFFYGSFFMLASFYLNSLFDEQPNKVIGWAPDNRESAFLFCILNFFTGYYSQMQPAYYPGSSWGY